VKRRKRREMSQEVGGLLDARGADECDYTGVMNDTNTLFN
jgi:hypothetical protein